MPRSLRTGNNGEASTLWPRISCRGWGRWRGSCGFLSGKPHTRTLGGPRSRKSGV